MTLKNNSSIFETIDLTWPAKEFLELPEWKLRKSIKGGKRVSAVTAIGKSGIPAIQFVENTLEEWCQDKLFMIKAGENSLDEALKERGYCIVDPTNIWSISAEALSMQKIPPVTAFSIFPPLAIQREIWTANGIDASRIEIMDRVKTPKTTIFGRINAKPAASAFVAVSNKIAMVHALIVDHKFQRQGMGKRVMQKVGVWAHQQGAESVVVLCTKQNQSANNFYKILGMKVIGEYHYRLFKT
jgi:GNAT superfamily N-acetyltransferase